MSVLHLRKSLAAIVFCLLVLQVGCVLIGPRPEHAIVTQHIGDQGIVRIQENTMSSITVNTGVLKSPVSRGSVFVYDNPVVRWEATTVDNQNITWRNNNGDTKLTSLSMIFPAMRWDGARKSGRRIISAVSGSLHPLKKGNKVTFHEDVLTSRPPGEYSGDWACEVQDIAAVTVPAGTFKTWEVLCMRNGREHILLNYAEQLGNNVRMIRVPENSSTPVVRQLMAVSPMAVGKKKETEPEKKTKIRNSSPSFSTMPSHKK